MAQQSLTQQAIVQQRLNQQRLTVNMATPTQVAAWMGAMQAQDYAGAKWAFGLRLPQASDEAIEQAFNAGAILRTHVLRPTWHFVAPEDIRWMLELTGPRVNVWCGTYYRKLGLDEATMQRSNAVIARALEGGKHLTRAELGAHLEDAGISTVDLRLGFLMSRAELDAIVCSGPRRGKQFTYALLDERAPQAKSLPREAALAELTRRYFTSHGPATLHDFVWWSGLTVADAKEGLALAGDELEQAVSAGETYWFSSATLPVTDLMPRAHLLPTFDEFLVGYRGFDVARRSGGELVFESTIVVDGAVVGSWKRTAKKREVLVELAPFGVLDVDIAEAIQAAAQRYGAFVAMPVVTQLR